MAIQYKIEKIEGFDDDTDTEAALNVEGANDWDLVQVILSTDAEKGTVAYCVFKK